MRAVLRRVVTQHGLQLGFGQLAVAAASAVLAAAAALHMLRARIFTMASLRALLAVNADPSFWNSA